MENNINANKDILIYAFRYSLGRMSFAPLTVSEAIKDNIEKIPQEDLKLLIQEIDECQNYGMDFDKEHWINFSKYLKTKVNRISNKEDVPKNNIVVNRDILIYAFRYSLNETGSELSPIVGNIIESNIEKISDHDIQLFIREIKEYQSYGEKYHREYFSELIYYLEKAIKNRD